MSSSNKNKLYLTITILLYIHKITIQALPKLQKKSSLNPVFIGVFKHIKIIKYSAYFEVFRHFKIIKNPWFNGDF